jgi:prepilin-type N-terminal cleavage/methylation domain-containing protein
MKRKVKAVGSSGFTLVELLIVIIVLGILVAIVLFSLGTFKSDSQSSACATDTKQLRTAETAYFVKYNASTDVAGLVNANFLQSPPDPGTDGVALTVSADANGNVIVSPQCP